VRGADLTISRHAWLAQFVELARPIFEAAGHPLPAVHVTSGRTSKPKYLGECWSDRDSAAGYREVVVCAKTGDRLQAASTLVHELCHAALEFSAKHGPKFSKLGKAMGLSGRPKSMSHHDDPAAFLAIWGPVLDQLPELPPPMNWDTGREPGNAVKKGQKLIISFICDNCESKFMLPRNVAEARAEAGGKVHCPCCGNEGDMEEWQA